MEKIVFDPLSRLAWESCGIPYFQVDEDTYWSGDAKQRYNEMVSLTDYPDLDVDNSEHIMDYGYEYQWMCSR